ncbi:phage tail-collar fiber domain-containing protein [Salmonella sp. NW603]|uniref:phage tail-collar fiber domain-containing protein n=1 Tax=Salmonella sp. NW603 TaxID=2948131 RepID=UPI003F42A34F|nr:phage tail protein [Salmonella enterica]
MAQSVITSAFEHLKAQEATGGNRIIIDQFVFANIPGLNVTDTPPESEPLPPDAQIVHRQAVDRNGVVNENTVAYSVTLPESVGDFTFNWLGLVSSATNTLCMAVYLHPQEKIKTADGKQGNTLIYSEIMEYAGASAATGITTPVSTWQIDFTARLHGMDEATRKAALDIYGPGLFFNDAFKLTAQATGQATFAPGIAYLRGLRVELGVPGTLTYSTGISQTVYIDAALTGTLTGENKATFSLTSQKSADYIDSLGFAHYVEPVATISASGEITDIRKTRKPLNDRLDGEYLTRDGNLKEIADKGEQAQSAAREHVGLGNSATRNVGTTPGTVAAGNDSRITGAMQKDQNGADIPDKPGFIKNVGLKETVNQAAGAMQKSQNGADITDTALFRQSIGVYDASTSQKGLVRLNGGVSDADDTLGATSGAVKIAYDAAQSAYRLALSKYTADGATTGKAGLVQLVNSMGGSGSLVMPQAAVTTAIQTYPSLGKGQTLQDLRGSRSIDATYTNLTGFPIAVYVRISGGYSAVLYTYVNGIEFGGGGSTASNTSIATTFFIVPNGATYRVTATGESPALQMWSELR